MRHDPARHARVLAVAGSGKTTTMAHRIAWLVREQGVPPNLIRAVMYNKSAQLDFVRKLEALGLGEVKVQTFHAMGWALLGYASKQGLLPQLRLVSTSREHFRLIRQAIRKVKDERRDELGFRSIDADDVMEAIGAWKAMLTPPERAGHASDPALSWVYEAFEAMRYREGWATFDDQIYESVLQLQRHEALLGALQDKIEHFIVDEFQDVNLARLTMVKLLAGKRARVMVVGDDDQCIYEWQGARSSFIRERFQREFTHHEHSQYTLTSSFRFGPLIAQVAANVIRHNRERVPKPLVAHDLCAGGLVEVEISTGASEARRRIEALLEGGTAPDDLVVLVRKYAQSHALQAELLAREVPFFVDGAQDWRTSPVVKLALNYLDLVAALREPLTDAVIAAATGVVNKPVRYVKRVIFEDLLRRATRSGRSISSVLGQPWVARRAGISGSAPEALEELGRDLAQAASGQLHAPAHLSAAEPGSPPSAGAALSILLELIDFEAHFAENDSAGARDGDAELLVGFSALLEGARVPLGEAREWLDGLDTRRGLPELQCVRITSIFKAKGLEWDHVLMPDVVERQHPDLRAFVDAAFDEEDSTRAGEPTDTLESERRLFYVAITRARQSVTLFAEDDPKRPPSRFIEEMLLDPTRRGVHAFQGDDTGGVVAAARVDEGLRDGLVEMARRAGDEGLAERLARAKAKSFSYGRVYDAVGKGGGGLPF